MEPRAAASAAERSKTPQPHESAIFAFITRPYSIMRACSYSRMQPAKPASPEPEKISLKEFLEKVPPGRHVLVESLVVQVPHPNRNVYRLNLPVLELHCTTDSCNGIRFFGVAESPFLDPYNPADVFATFRCRNCGESLKTYALRASMNRKDCSGMVRKFGEIPEFGPPTPARVITLIGPDKDFYLKGRRAENQGLGIAAFAYYRRVVENQKNRILDEIIRVGVKIGASKELLDDLNAAKKETQFTRAVEAVKHGIPPVLMINGHNPLTLLHSALSEGMHEHTDDECLQLATSIRVVLSDLAVKLGNALSDQAELNAAVDKLFRAKAPKTEPADTGVQSE